MSEPEAAGPAAEGTGETVGEARWAALRELQRLEPGVIAEDVEYVVVSEGERGLMGVGREPARVIARSSVRPELGETARRVGEVVSRIAAGIDPALRVTLREVDERIVATVDGGDAGLLIGRHGHTIDAIQHLAAAIACPPGSDRREIVVDAQGYRERRDRRLREIASSAAAEALRLGEAVELEPMSAAERKVVHLALAEREDVETASDGREPERFVVVRPTSGDEA